MSWRLVRTAALVMLVGLAYSYTWYWLYVRWSAPDSLFAHGFLIPLVCLWLVSRRFSVLKAIEPDPDYKGLLLVVPALILHLCAVYLEVYSPSGFTLPFLVGGILLYLRGFKTFKILLFPVFFLFFAIPLPMNWVQALSFRLKIVAVQGATSLARTLGAELTDRGSRIYFSPDDYLPVESPCSGLRSLVALTALAVLYAVEFTSLRIAGKLFFIALALPIAMISNMLRIAFLCLIADKLGTRAASGAVHDLSGYAIYIVALLLMIACGRLLAAFPIFLRREPCQADS